MEVKMNKIVLGDSYTYLKSIPDHSIDLIITDPPYDLSINHSGGWLFKNRGLDKQFQSDIVDNNLDQSYDIEKYGEEFIRVMKGINIYIWCNKKQIPEYFNFYVNKHKCKFDILTWHKTNPIPTYSNKYVSDTEYCLYFRKGKGHCFPESYEDAFTYYITPLNAKDKKEWGHPTIKPLEFTERLIRNSSRKAEVVLDPFMGSGTTCLAAKNNGREFIGIEINEEYYNIAKRRIGDGYVEQKDEGVL